MRRLQSILFALILSITVTAKEYHVAKSGDDANNGAIDSPFLSIQAAADIAQAGDVITIHKGVTVKAFLHPAEVTPDQSHYIPGGRR